MKKILLYLMIFIGAAIPVISMAASNTTSAKKTAGIYISASTKHAIQCYRNENYTEAYQTLHDYVEKCKTPDVFAEYYLALSAWKINRISEAKMYMNRVLSHNPPGVLRAYAKQANDCLSDYSSCMSGDLSSDGSRAMQESALDSFIRNNGADVSKSVYTDFEQKHLDVLKYEINSSKDLDEYTFQKYKDYSKK